MGPEKDGGDVVMRDSAEAGEGGIHDELGVAVIFDDKDEAELDDERYKVTNGSDDDEDDDEEEDGKDEEEEEEEEGDMEVDEEVAASREESARDAGGWEEIERIGAELLEVTSLSDDEKAEGLKTMRKVQSSL